MIGSVFAVTLLLQASGSHPLPNLPAADLTNEANTTSRNPIPTDASERQRLGVVCRRETEMGSNRARRICTTAAQRDEARTNAERTLDRHATGTPTDAPISNRQND